MKDLPTLRRDVLAAFPAVTDAVGGDLGEARRALLERSRQRLASDRYVVVVVGEFRRGKSSLLNALLERKGLFPVDVDVTTSVVTTVEWGDEERAVVHFSPSDPSDPATAPAPKAVPLDEVAAFVTEQANPGNRYDVSHVEIRAPLEPLRSGLMFADCPGVGSLNSAHTGATYAFLPRADAVLFVAAAGQPLSTLELDVLAAAVAECPVVLTAVTKTDTVVEPAAAVDEVRRRVAAVVGKPADQLTVVGVSSLRKRRGRDLGDEEMVAQSGFAELEAELWGGLGATCGRNQLLEGIGALDAAVGDGEAPVANELAALTDDESLARMDRDLKEAQDKLKELRSGGSKWKRNLSEELEMGSRPIREQLTQDFEELRDAFRRAVDSEEALRSPEAIATRCWTGMSAAVQRADADLLELVGDVAGRYTEETTVSLTGSRLPEPMTSGPATQELEAYEHRPQRSETYGRFRSGWSGLSAGSGAALLATTAASFIIPIAPIVVLGAGVVGAVLGWMGGRRQREEQDTAKREGAQRKHLREQVMPKIDSVKRRAEREFGDKIRDATRGLTATLDDQLTARSDSLNDSVARLQKSRKRSGDDRAGRKRELEAARTVFAGLRTTLDRLRAEADGLGRPQGR